MPQECKSCGHIADDEAKYCPKCHTALDRTWIDENKNDISELNSMAKKALVYSILCIICAPASAVLLSLFKGQLFLYSLSTLLPWAAFFIVGVIYLFKSIHATKKIFISIAILLFLLSLILLPTIWIPLRIKIIGSLSIF